MGEYISIENIAFKYLPPPADNVLEDISFNVNRGGIFYLLGPNGTGKSTLLKCLAGVLRVQSGEIRLEGRDIYSLRPKETAKKLAFVPQSHSSAFPYSVRDIVVMGRSPHINTLSSPSPDDFGRADSALETAGISGLGSRPCTELSGGEWQLVLIARALAQEPEIMLLDEPTSHLDLGNQIKILRVIQNLSDKGLTIIVSTHFPDHAFINSDTVAIIKDKHLMEIGRSEIVINARNMKKAYGVDVRIMDLGDGIDRRICVPVISR